MATRWLIVLILLGLSATANPLSASEPLYASFLSKYWSGFTTFWSGAFKSQGAVVTTVLLVGALALFIITRGGKWKK